MTNEARPESIGRRHTNNRIALAGKRLIDVLFGTFALLLAVPVMLGAALLVLICDGRPILFRQQRVGRHGKPFTILKFRTMVTGAERMVDQLQARNERRGPLFKLTNDPRVTRVGRLLRDSSIDELPQLLNVIRGEMSLVGPRPALASETARFAPSFAEARHQVRPGITGLWQVSARDHAAFDAYERLDRLYVESRTLRLDLAILVLTLPVVVLGAWRRVIGNGVAAAEPVAVVTAPWQSTLWYRRNARAAEASLLAVHQQHQAG